MKKFIAYGLWLIALFLLFTPSVYAAGASLSVSPASGTFNKSCTFSADVVVDTGGAQTDGTDAILFYDNTRFTATKIRSGTIYSDYPGSIIDAQAGKITISGLSSVSSAYQGSGVLAGIDFAVLPEAPEGATQITFDFDPNDKGKTTDSNIVERGTVTDILSGVNNATFTVGSGTCGTAVTPTPGGTGTGLGTVGQGGVNDSSTNILPTPTVLPQAANLEGVVLIGVAGGILVVLGILGLVLL